MPEFEAELMDREAGVAYAEESLREREDKVWEHVSTHHVTAQQCTVLDLLPS